MPKGRISFEQAFQKLEETVRALDAGGLTLQEATSLFEEGIRLVRLCQELLGKAELKITQLQAALGEQIPLISSGPEEEEAED